MVFKSVGAIQRYRIFFYADKFVGHSFIQIRKSCFFFPKAKKKQDVFFSFRGKVHRPFIPILMKSSFFFNKSDLFFFLRILRVFLCSFFSADKFTCHSFIQFWRPEKKKHNPEKKNSFFIHSIEIPQKCAKTNLSV